MIHIFNGVADRQPIPSFLQGLQPESLADLSWVDPELGIQGHCWWPEVDASTPIDTHLQKYDGETFTIDAQNQTVSVQRTAVDLTADEIAAIRAAQVPASVSPRQIREALIDSGLIDAVESAVAAGDRKLQNWWEFATEFQRTHPKVVAMGESLGVSPRQLDDLWILAGSL